MNDGGQDPEPVICEATAISEQQGIASEKIASALREW